MHGVSHIYTTVRGRGKENYPLENLQSCTHLNLSQPIGKIVFDLQALDYSGDPETRLDRPSALPQGCNPRTVTPDKRLNPDKEPWRTRALRACFVQ